MLVRVTLETGTEYALDLKLNEISSLEELGQNIELAPGRMLKVDDGKTRIKSSAIVVVKEL